MTLTKDAIISAVAADNHYPRNQATELVKTLLELNRSKLVAGEDVMVSGFGKFCVREKRERQRRNPATCEGMMPGAKRVVPFKCSGKLRKKINESW